MHECVCALKGISECNCTFFMTSEKRIQHKYGDNVVGDFTVHMVRGQRANLAMRQNLSLEIIITFSISNNTNLGVTVTPGLWARQDHKDILCPCSVLGFIIVKGKQDNQ